MTKVLDLQLMAPRGVEEPPQFTEGSGFSIGC
jgi:hypothetical protein